MKYNKRQLVVNPDGTFSVKKPIIKYGQQFDDFHLLLFIHGNVPSKKNSKRLGVREGIKKDGTMGFLPTIRCSKATNRYALESESQYIDLAPIFRKVYNSLEKPIKVEFLFFRETIQEWDFPNLCQMPLDLMVKHDWIADDNVNCILPYPPPCLPFWAVDKNNSGLQLKIMK